jgi:HNH endonuclease
VPNRPISQFFHTLGYPLQSTRWSWGAHTRRGVLLRTWADETANNGAFVKVLFAPEQHGGNKSPGLPERVDHLRMLWSGGLAGYVVMAKAVDISARPRKIASYDEEKVQAIATLFEDGDGSLWAELGEQVPVGRLDRHSANYRLRASQVAFPVMAEASSLSAKPSAASYMAKLPAMRQWLIDVARRNGTVTYAEARAPFAMRTFEHRHAMDRIGNECVELGEPILTSLIVDPDTGRCSIGFEKEFGRDDALERADCHAFWTEGLPVAGHPGQAAPLPQLEYGELRERARKFSQVERRPHQRAFRGRVFWACKGACMVTGCRVVEALDAAHRRGRDWRQGHNREEDGLLLRKDIHAMYDAGLIDIGEDGAVTFAHAVMDHYQQYARTA